MVKVLTSVRLHMGQMDLNGGLGRWFGGIGLAVSGPGVVLDVERSDFFTVEGPEKEKVGALTRCYLKEWGLGDNIRVRVKRLIPAHVGLGSQTQLALALGRAIAVLHGLELAVNDIAALTDRGGSRSGIGVGAFERGGFLIDGGRKDKDSREIPPVLVRLAFPRDWRFVVAVPKSPRGPHGEDEARAFRELGPVPEETVGRVCRLILVRLLPALVERDIEAFGSALTEIQRLVGKHYAPVQKGVYAGPWGEKLVNFMLARGARGAGQSSWGPAVYGLVRAGAEQVLADEVRSFLGVQGEMVFCAAGWNHGAYCTVENGESSVTKPDSDEWGGIPVEESLVADGYRCGAQCFRPGRRI